MAKQKNETTKGANKPTALKRRKDENPGKGLATTPFTFMRRFSDEMEKLFDDFGFGRNWLTPMFGAQLPQGLWSPQVEMFERDHQLVLRADLPGLTKDDVSVELTDDAIAIEGERRSEQEENREGFYRSERSYGKFYRRLPLPEGVKAGNANATFNNGVLEVTMEAPKLESGKAKRLEIRDESPPQAKRKAA